MSCKYFWKPSFLSWDISFFPLFLSYFSRFFECNYGNSRTPFDKMFGTFRDKLAEDGTSYRGGSEEKVPGKKRCSEGKTIWEKVIFNNLSLKILQYLYHFPLRWTRNPPQLTTPKPLYWVLLILALLSTWRSISASGSGFGSRRPSSMGWRSSTLTTWPSLSALVLSFWHRWPVE